MSMQITNYLCPACGGPLRFSETEGKVVCDYCDSAFDIQYVEDYYAAKDAQAAAAKEEADSQQAKTEEHITSGDDTWTMQTQQGWGEDAEGMKLYSCPSCGAQLVCDDTTGATSCPYCGNPTIVPGTFSGMLKPDYVIPFAVTKETAVSQLKAFYKHKPFLPKAFSGSNHIEEVQGIYVPFWLYSGEADAQVRFTATRSYSTSTPRETITTTEHYDVFRSGAVAFDKIPADGSSKMPDDYMDALEPYDYTKLVPFSTAYLPGFMADRYDVTAEDCATRAGNRARNSAVDAMKSDVVGYQTCAVNSANVELHRGRTEYALLPVWVLHTKYGGQDYLFTMNGQTGKMAGKLPSSKGRMAAWFMGIFAGVTGAIALAMTFL